MRHQDIALKFNKQGAFPAGMRGWSFIISISQEAESLHDHAPFLNLKIMDTYEKKYNEALKWMRELYPGLHGATKEDAEHYFPELRESESEDERIRKWLADYFSSIKKTVWIHRDITCEQILDWLEKQKEQNKCPEFCSGHCVGCEQKEQKPLETPSPSVIYTEQGDVLAEQKPASTEDMPYITDEHFYEREPADSFKYKLAEYMTRCCTKKEGPYGYEYGISAESILKMAKEELLKRGELKEQKPAEKQDYSGLNDLERAIHRGFISAGVENVPVTIIKETAKECLAQMKPAEWSEEDERKIVELKTFLAKCNGFNKSNRQKAFEMIDSLRPSWKPSEEQMKALERASTNEYLSAKQFDILVSLYEQLKKL